MLLFKSLENSHRSTPIARRLAAAYASILDRVVPRLRRVARKNLAMAYPERSPSPIAKPIIDGGFRSIGRVLLAIARFPLHHPRHCCPVDSATGRLRAFRTCPRTR